MNEFSLSGGVAPHDSKSRCIRLGMILGLLCLLVAPGVENSQAAASSGSSSRSQTPTAVSSGSKSSSSNTAPSASSMGNRFLVVVENAASTKRIDAKIYATFFFLFGGSLYDRIQEGDTLGIWLLNADTDTRFPMKFWEYSNRGSLAGDAVNFLKETGFKKRTRWDVLKKNLELVIANVRDLTVFLVVDGDEPPTGTPFDKDIHQWFTQHAADAIKDREPVIIGLAARGGKITAFSIGRAGEKLELPPEPARPPRNTAVAQSDSKEGGSAVQPTLPRRTTPIIISKSNMGTTIEPGSTPAPTPAGPERQAFPTESTPHPATIPVAPATVPARVASPPVAALPSVPFLPEVGPEPPRIANAATQTSGNRFAGATSSPALIPPPAVPRVVTQPIAVPNSLTSSSNPTAPTGSLAGEAIARLPVVLPSGPELNAIQTGGVVEVVLQLSSNGLQVVTSRPPKATLTASSSSSSGASSSSNSSHIGSSQLAGKSTPSNPTPTVAASVVSNPAPASSGILPQVTAQARSPLGSSSGGSFPGAATEQGPSWLRLGLAGACLGTALIWGFWMTRRKPRESSITRLMPRK